MAQKILVVDDEPEIVKLVRAYLERAGFIVVTAYEGQQALAVFRHERPNLVVLDLNLPGMDGLDVCRVMRRDADVPIIMLTARIEETDRLIGLELGADDYVVKPFSPREIVARVRAVLRRTEGVPVRPKMISAAGITVDLTTRIASISGQPLDLTTMEFDLLAVLVGHPGLVFTRMQLLEQTQDVTYEGYERTIDVHVKNLRKKLGDDSQNPHFIETVRGVGYRFRPEDV
ncbi:MAG TPA: response regulator transcription factor [Anaerolineales bacterium]|jgi:two-component system alkaline phosphatase synthesis response regulator PhoP|nr:response regulator transcription factor [Anaerolineales bacterium]HLE16557.1 response regulator transcription factor [Anaerolineales bacterium]